MDGTNSVGEIETRLYIGGIRRESSDRKSFPVHDPSTGKQIAFMCDATPEDALEALSAANTAQEAWAQVSSRERSDILRRAFERLLGQADTFAHTIALEMGKSLKEAHGEVLYAAEFLRWFSEEAVRVNGRYQAAPNGALQHLIIKKPVGPCLIITPWNFPLAMIARKVGPAVAAGCTMIVKPAELTPLTSSMFTSLMCESGLPAGVMNMIATTRAEGVVSALLSDTRLRKVSFTGSTRVGRFILAGAAQNVLRTSMELGGNAPFIVFEDANLDAAIDGAIQAKLRNIGQACTAANRFYIHSSLYDEFVGRLSEEFSKIELGSGTCGGDVMGPLISETARESVHGKVVDALDQGATLICGGEIPSGPGSFYPPTILTDVSVTARITQMEIFGPVAPIIRFDDQDTVLNLSNGSDVGLAAYIYCQELPRALNIAGRLQTGMVGINTGMISDPAAPFGGVKQSGFGREGGAEGINEYLSIQYSGIARRSS